MQLTAPSPSSRLRKLPAATRRALGLALSTAGIGYCVLVVAAYLHLTTPGSLFPDAHELGQLLFSSAQPISQIERLLEATGDMDSGGSMRPAFTEQSTGWEELIKPLSVDELAALRAEREGERLALLDWVRSGGGQAAYDADDHLSATLSPETPLTPAYLINEIGGEAKAMPHRIRIRSLITDRCVACHGENGRHDTARFISLHGYENLARRLRPEQTDSGRRRWLFSALFALYPLAALACPAFAFTSQPLAMRKKLLAVTIAALGLIPIFWFAGSVTTIMLLTAVTVAAVCILVQAIASIGELVG